MPRILRIINRFNLGGPTLNAALLSKYVDAPYETLLIGGKEEESEESSLHLLDQLDLEATIIPEMQREIGLGNDIAAYKKLSKIIKEYQPDIIHTHASKAGAIGRLAGKHNSKAKLVHTFHGHVFHSYFNPLKTNFYKGVERYLAGFSDRIIAISETQKKELVEVHKICNADKVSVIPLGFDLSKFEQNQEEKRQSFRKQFKLDESDVAIGIIGRLVPIKNHKLFIDSFADIIANSNQKVVGFIIGDGSEYKSLIEYAKNRGLKVGEGKSRESEVDLQFTSWIKNIDWAYAGLDIVALSSLNEGTPVSLIEAQAAGKSIITTNVGGISDIVIDQKTALIVGSNNQKELSKKLLQLTENKELRHQLSQEGRLFVKEKFHYSRLVSDVKSLYNELLDL